ncbi:hypothetical protein MKX54_03565 [Alkalihalobacillus sp. FSL R5-0424]
MSNYELINLGLLEDKLIEHNLLDDKTIDYYFEKATETVMDFQPRAGEYFPVQFDRGVVGTFGLTDDYERTLEHEDDDIPYFFVSLLVRKSE